MVVYRATDQGAPCAAAGAERLFEDFNDRLPGPVDPEPFAALARANWVEFVGAPLSVSDPLEPA